MEPPSKRTAFVRIARRGFFVTREQKQQITSLRKQGCGYAAIAKTVALSVNTVKSFCRRNGLNRAFTDVSAPVCPFCGGALVQRPQVKPRRFCSDSCRRAWWKAHPEASIKKAYYEKVCAYCAKPYIVYGRPESKYCSLDCAHNARKAEANT